MTYSEKNTPVINPNDSKQRNKMQRQPSLKTNTKSSLKRPKRCGVEIETVRLNNGRDHLHCNGGGGVSRHVSKNSYYIYIGCQRNK